MSLKVAIQMDPIGPIDIDADSTSRIALEAQARGHELFYYLPEHLSYREGRVLAQQGLSEPLAATLEQRGEVTARDVIRAARVGDSAAHQLLDRSATLVGQTLAGLANFFNPSLIVIGGVWLTFLSTGRPRLAAPEPAKSAET